MKMRINYAQGKDIDDIVEKWARTSGFREEYSPVRIRPDDVAYCFSHDDGDKKTFIAINTLDDEVHIEAWTVADINNRDVPKAQINRLLSMIKSGLTDGDG